MLFMETIQSILSSDTFPWLSAILLGLLTAINPCQLAMNLMAIGYIAKETPKHAFKYSLVYALGRICVYTILGITLIYILHQGATILPIQNFLGNYGELLLSPILIVVGSVILIHGLGHDHSLTEGDNCHHHTKPKAKGIYGAFLLGVLFALAFCPETAIFYFGMLIPLSFESTIGYTLPFIYAVITALPVLFFAGIISYGTDKSTKYLNKIQKIQKWLTAILGALFTIMGIWLLIENI